MIIEKLVIKTGTACTLQCEKCGEFNPYLSKKRKSYMLAAETLSRDLYRIAQAVEKIETVHIAGGEALLHKDLFLFLAFAYALSNVEKIEIVTNGTVVPDNLLLALLRGMQSKVIVLISDYSLSGVDSSGVVDVLRKNGISHYVMKDIRWQDRSDVSCKQLDREELLEIAQNCKSYRQNPYFTLIDGIISAHCPTAGSLLYYLDIYEECGKNYRDIRRIPDEKVLSELSAINNVECLRMCNYCVPSWKVKECQAAKQIKRQGENI